MLAAQARRHNRCSDLSQRNERQGNGFDLERCRRLRESALARAPPLQLPRWHGRLQLRPGLFSRNRSAGNRRVSATMEKGKSRIAPVPYTNRVAGPFRTLGSAAAKSGSPWMPDSQKNRASNPVAGKTCSTEPFERTRAVAQPLIKMTPAAPKVWRAILSLRELMGNHAGSTTRRTGRCACLPRRHAEFDVLRSRDWCICSLSSEAAGKLRPE